jgi:glycosyltransferase involved in cell wall biosynthesis
MTTEAVRPAFSVLSPVYNSAAFVERSWHCLQQQTFTDWEWIVVDDGSPDDSARIARAIADPRVRVLSYTPNRGRGNARNVALEASRGEWIVIWDIDDMYFPDRLEKINAARLAGYDFACSYAVVVDNDLAVKGVRGFHPRSPGLPRYFVHPTLACRTEVARRIGYDPEFRIGEDAPITWGLDDNYRGCYIEEALAIYQEEREISLGKAIDSKTAHLTQMRKLYRQGMVRAGTLGRFVLLAKWEAKLAVLKLMRVAPDLYRQTLKFRSYGARHEGFQLSPQRMAFLEQLRSRTWHG